MIVRASLASELCGNAEGLPKNNRMKNQSRRGSGLVGVSAPDVGNRRLAFGLSPTRNHKERAQVDKNKRTLTEHLSYSSRKGQTLQAASRRRENERKKHGSAQRSNHTDPQTRNLQKMAPAREQVNLCRNDARPRDGQKRHGSDTNAQTRGRGPHAHTQNRPLDPQEDLVELAVRDSREFCGTAEAISNDPAVSGEDVIHDVIVLKLARSELVTIAKAQFRVHVKNKAIDVRRKQETRLKNRDRFETADSPPTPEAAVERCENQRVATELVAQLHGRDLSHARSIMRGESAAEYGRRRNQSRWAASDERRDVLKRLRKMLTQS